MTPMAKVEGANVNIGLQELIQLMAKDIAQEVAANLKADHIEPLTRRVEELERKMVNPPSFQQIDSNHLPPYLQGALDSIWKAGVILYVGFGMYMKLKGH